MIDKTLRTDILIPTNPKQVPPNSEMVYVSHVKF